MITNGTVIVNNVPEYAKDYKYWVVTLYDATLWFFGAWNEEETATEVAKLQDGFVVYNN